MNKILVDKWTTTAFVIFFILLIDSAYGLAWLTQQNMPDVPEGTPMLSEAILTAPYAREIFVIALLGTVFLAQRCNDHASNIVAWLWVISFINLENDYIHRIYVGAAALASVVAITVSKAVPVWFKVMTIIASVVFVAVMLLNPGKQRSYWFISEYIAIMFVLVGMVLRIRSGCATSKNTDLMCSNCNY